MRLDVNVDAVVKYSNKLDKLGKYTLPKVVMNTLNNVAFDMKQKTLLNTTDSEFTNRTKNFFKVFSKVDKAKGNDINSMVAIVGFTERGLKGGNNYSVKDLEEQEKGGKIGGRKYIPLKFARLGKSNNRLVSPKNRISNIKKIVDSKKIQGENRKESFIKAAILAGSGGFVEGEKYLYRIDAVYSNIKNQNTKIRKQAIYKINDSKSVTIKKPTHFVEKSANKAGVNMEKYFIRNAKKEIFK